MCKKLLSKAISNLKNILDIIIDVKNIITTSDCPLMDPPSIKNVLNDDGSLFMDFNNEPICIGDRIMVSWSVDNTHSVSSECIIRYSKPFDLRYPYMIKINGYQTFPLSEFLLMYSKIKMTKRIKKVAHT